MKANIGMIQFEPIAGDVKTNTEKAINMLEKTVTLGADILCLPELFSTGYDQLGLRSNYVSLAIESSTYTIERIKKFCACNNVSVIAPVAEFCKKHSVIYNSAYVINHLGDICHTYRKIHLWNEEKHNFKQGSELKAFSIKGIMAAIMICYDAGFPEVCRILTLDGAKIIFVPTAWFEETSFYITMAARALENGVFIVAVNRTGYEGNLSFFGSSTIFSPKGEKIFSLEKGKEDIGFFQLDLSQISKFRKDIPYLYDRKPWLYKKISQPC